MPLLRRRRWHSRARLRLHLALLRSRRRLLLRGRLHLTFLPRRLHLTLLSRGGLRLNAPLLRRRDLTPFRRLRLNALFLR